MCRELCPFVFANPCAGALIPWPPTFIISLSRCGKSFSRPCLQVLRPLCPSSPPWIPSRVSRTQGSASQHEASLPSNLAPGASVPCRQGPRHSCRGRSAQTPRRVPAGAGPQNVTINIPPSLSAPPAYLIYSPLSVLISVHHKTEPSSRPPTHPALHAATNTPFRGRNATPAIWSAPRGLRSREGSGLAGAASSEKGTRQAPTNMLPY